MVVVSAVYLNKKKSIRKMEKELHHKVNLHL